MSYKESIAKTLKHEGGYSNHPSDTGGMTYKGVAFNHWPKWEGWNIIKPVVEKHKGNAKAINEELEKDQKLQDMIIEFYKQNFWDKCKCDDIKSEKLAGFVFDHAVNAGNGRSGKLLQQTINALNNCGKIIADVVVDGAVGPATIKAINAVIDNRKEALVCKTFQCYRFAYYDSIAKGNNRAFLAGWISRLEF